MVEKNYNTFDLYKNRVLTGLTNQLRRYGQIERSRLYNQTIIDLSLKAVSDYFSQAVDLDCANEAVEICQRIIPAKEPVKEKIL